jgi:hypothetical protein
MIMLQTPPNREPDRLSRPGDFIRHRGAEAAGRTVDSRDGQRQMTSRHIAGAAGPPDCDTTPTW